MDFLTKPVSGSALLRSVAVALAREQDQHDQASRNHHAASLIDLTRIARDAGIDE